MRVLVNYETLLSRSGVENCGPLRYVSRGNFRSKTTWYHEFHEIREIRGEKFQILPWLCRGDRFTTVKNFFSLLLFFFCILESRIFWIIFFFPFFFFLFLQHPPLSRLFVRKCIMDHKLFDEGFLRDLNYWINWECKYL